MAFMQRISAYELACGASYSKEYGSINICLWKEHNAYHVRAHDHATNTRRFWEVFDTLEDAKRHYKRAIREME